MCGKEHYLNGELHGIAEYFCYESECESGSVIIERTYEDGKIISEKEFKCEGCQSLQKKIERNVICECFDPLDQYPGSKYYRVCYNCRKDYLKRVYPSQFSEISIYKHLMGKISELNSKTT